MPRSKKWRRVGFVPPATYFKPAEVPARLLKEVAISVEEVEALRLKEMQGLDPEECAQHMCISRPTFHRVLSSARCKVAEAVVMGKALRIQGGAFLPATQTFVCAEDGYRWQVSFQEVVSNAALVCPQCRSSDVEPLRHLAQHSRGGRAQRRRRGGNRWSS